MRKFFRFWEILIVGILLTAFAVTTAVTNIILDEKTVRKELKDSGVYTKFNEKLKEEVRNELKSDFDKYPEFSKKLDDMIDKTITVDIIEAETTIILEQIYDNKEKIEIDPVDLIDRYSSNFKKYLADNDINLPSELDRAIEEVKDEARQKGKIDVLDGEEDMKDTIQTFNEYKDIMQTIKYIILAITLIFMGFAVLVSKAKLKVIYKPLIFAAILLMIGRFALTAALDTINYNEIDEETARNLVITVKNTVLSNIDKFAIIYMAVGIGLMILRIVLANKNDKEKKDPLYTGDSIEPTGE